ncbi:MAG: 50S ribosomal protein L22 [Armatimonadota bacterium]
MDATVARVRDFVRSQVEGERIWRVGVKLTKDSGTVTLYTPDNPERLVDERSKGREPIIARVDRELKKQFGPQMSVKVVQSPTAVAKYIRISPRKVRFVVDAIRGKHVQDALAILQFVPNNAARTVSKLLKSAIANAENNHRMDSDSLEVIHIHVDEGPTLKRISPRAMGRAYRIMKRTSHITVGLGESSGPARIGRSGKSVAKTVAKAPRKAKAEGTTRAKRPETAATASKSSGESKAKAPRRQAKKGGE